MYPKIFITTYKGDFYLAKIAVASIRYWYPNDDVEIWLNKDLGKGDFDTSELEKYFNVKIFKNQKIKTYGNVFAKLEPMFEYKIGEKILLLDSDIAFLGRFLDKFINSNSDFIVSGFEMDINSEKFKELYYDYDLLKKIDKEFEPLYYGFNTGQIFWTVGKISRDEILPIIDINKPYPKLKYPEVFKYGDQGVLNYVFHKLERAKRITVEKVKMELWPCDGGTNFIKLENLRNKTGYPYIIHWAGCASKCRNFGIERRIFKFYEDFYFQTIKASKLKRFFIIANNCKERYFKYYKKKLLG